MNVDIETSLKNLNITSQESEKLAEAFKDPGFTKLFQEYVQEISDPSTRAQYEKDIQEYESKFGVDTKFINSEPHYVLKTRDWSKDGKSSIKTFLNICSSSVIEAPEILKSGEGTEISLPHSFSPIREEFVDGVKVKITDVTYNPEIFKTKDPRVLNYINSTAIDGAIAKFNLRPGKTLEQAEEFENMKDDSKKSYSLRLIHVLKNVKSKGTIKSTVIRRKNQSMVKADLDESLRPPHLEKIIKDKPNETQPDYKIVYGNNFDMMSCANDDRIRPGTLPEYIRVEINLPKFNSAQQFDLDLTKTHLLFSSNAPEKLELCLELKYEIDEMKAEAKFDKTTRKLSVTMPLLRNNWNENMSPGRFQITSLSNGVKEDENTPSSSVVPSPEKPDVSSVKICPEQIFQTIDKGLIEIENINPVNLEIPKDVPLLPIKLFQDGTTFTILLCVRQIIASSIKINWTKRKIAKNDFEDIFSTITEHHSDKYIPSHFMSIRVKCNATPSDSDETCVEREYGILLEFPALQRTLQKEYDDDEYDEDKPHVTMGEKVDLKHASCTSRNVALVFNKPMVNGNKSFFWSSVASGRTLDSGLLITQFHGINSAFNTLDQERESVFKKIIKGSNEGSKGRKHSDSFRFNQSDSSSYKKGILKKRNMSESDEVVFNHDFDFDHLLNAGVAQITPLDEKIEVKDFFSNANNSSLNSDNGQLSNSQPNSPNDSEAPNIGFSSQMPNSRRRFYSYTFDDDALFDLALDSLSESIENVQQNRNSSRLVLFSKHDAKLDFCPDESVTNLHHTILNRKKKAKAKERKRLSSICDAEEARRKSKKNGKKNVKYSFSQQQEKELNQTSKTESPKETPSSIDENVFTLEECATLDQNISSLKLESE